MSFFKKMFTSGSSADISPEGKGGQGGAGSKDTNEEGGKGHHQQGAAGEEKLSRQEKSSRRKSIMQRVRSIHTPSALPAAREVEESPEERRKREREAEEMHVDLHPGDVDPSLFRLHRYIIFPAHFSFHSFHF